MGSTRRAFTDEYKANAVALVIDGNRTNADVARNIGVNESTLGRWVNKARDGETTPPDKNATLSSSERDELERLRAENADLKLRYEFAKKVAAWFAKDQQ